MLNIIYEHIVEIIPFYIFFEMIYYFFKIFLDFNGIYFLLHFIVNLINTILLSPLIINLFMDPFFHNYEIDNWNNLTYIYPMLIGLHTFHLVHNVLSLKYDEIIHHVLTHIFWYGIYINNSVLYIAPIIGLSGIPGGLTYLMLFLQKINKIDRLTEKKISMYLNIWLRAPICIILATMMYFDNLENDNSYYLTLFMILFTIINGIHFMHNIIESYYENYYANYYKINKIK